MENNNNSGSHLISRLLLAIQSFAGFSVIWISLILLFSVFENTFNSFTHDLPSAFLGILLWSWLLDLVLWFKWLFFLFIIYATFYFISSKLAKILFQAFIILFFIFHLGLILYFNTSLVLLGADLYSYSSGDIKQTVGASSGINILSVFSFFLLILFVGFALRFLAPRIKFNRYAAAVLLAFGMLDLVFGFTEMISTPDLKSDFANNLAINKSDYFYRASYAHFFPEDNETDIYADSYIGDYADGQLKSIQFEYADESNYPFLHKEVAQDVLSPFFRAQASAPNIVIILVEGLGRAYSNDGAYLGNFTPFLDSLSGKSLYWKNFLSQGGRTFAVLPSILGSLPFAKNGFLELGENMPEQLSLLNMLKFNGYQTSFYCGADAAFDHMDQYLRANKIDELRDRKSFPPGYIKLPSTNGFTWGYNDKELFRYFLATRPDVQNKKPLLSVILTVATHDPFIINESAKYYRIFEERMKSLRLTESETNQYRKYKDQYSSILYVDDALRNFFNAYEKRADYGNTIFLITGDHRMPEIPMISKIDRYHVPFIIYSPLLKRTAEFSSVSSHFDIPPSMLAYLKNNHQIKVPALSSWIGKGLDTSRSFRNLHSLPFIQNKTDIIDFIMGEYHLNGDNLYKLSPDLAEEIVNDPERKSQMINAFNQFKKRNAMIADGKKIIPDSLFRNYTLPK
ncbi:MAG: sulfatase-like hydrolase/transferase [Daejeonella sp.]